MRHFLSVSLKLIGKMSFQSACNGLKTGSQTGVRGPPGATVQDEEQLHFTFYIPKKFLCKSHWG